MKRKIRLLAFMLAFVTLAVSSFSYTGTSAAPSLGQEKNQLESQLAALKNQSAQLQEQYNEAMKDVNDQKTALSLLYDQISTYQKELETLSELMEEYTAYKALKEKEIDDLNDFGAHVK